MESGLLRFLNIFANRLMYMELVKGANKKKLLLLVLIQMNGMEQKNKDPGVLLVIQEPKNQEIMVIVEVMPIIMKLRHLR